MESIRFFQKFEKYYVYRTENKFYLICCLKNKKNCCLMTIARNSFTLNIDIKKDFLSFENALLEIKKKIIEDEPEIKNEKTSHILSKFFFAKTYGIIGFPKFLDGYYLYMITKKQKIGDYLGSVIYKVAEAKLEMILNQELSCLFKMNSKKNDEIKYIEYFNYIDNQYMYFSYNVDLTNSIQTIITHSLKNEHLPLKSRFIWNNHLLNPLYEKENVSNEFILPIIYGFVDFQDLKINLKELTIGVISRRSRFNVGTRYLKRGINKDGNVANEVETELFLVENFAFEKKIKNICSYIFYRGSIPLFWGNQKSKSPKPDIILKLDEDEDYHASKIHLKDLFDRYGDNIYVLNMVKRSEKSKEYALGFEYKKFIEMYMNTMKYIKGPHSMKFHWFDFFEHYHSTESSLVKNIQILSHTLNKEISFFSYNLYEGVTSTQNGIIRINCIDCLDRTNNSMACISGVIIGKFLKKIELINVKRFLNAETKSVKNELLSIIFEIFGLNGDAIAQQYAGSEAFHKAQLYKINGDWKTVKQNIAFIAVKRYIYNILIDEEKQKTFYLFLGEFVPDPDQLENNLWDCLQAEDIKITNCKCAINNDKENLFEMITYGKKILNDIYKIDKIRKLKYFELPIIIEEEIQKKSKIIQKDKEKDNKKQKKIPEENEIKFNQYTFENDFKELEKKSQDMKFFLNYINKTSF